MGERKSRLSRAVLSTNDGDKNSSNSAGGSCQNDEEDGVGDIATISKILSKALKKQAVV